MVKQAVLLLAHGTPETVEQIPEYLRNVTSGRPIPPPVIEEIQHRYASIGRSPLTEITYEQARMIEAELAAAGRPAPAYVGMRNWRPYIADVMKKMRADGVEEAAVICMAPQNSRTSVGLYRRAVEAEAGGLRFDFTPSWADHPLLADAFAERLRPAWQKLSAEAGAPVPVLFTAHSVPTRTVQASEPGSPATGFHRWGGEPGVETGPRLWPGQGVDPYAQEAHHTAELVAARVPQIPKWWFAFQSQGASGGPWLGPTVEETIESIAASGAGYMILQPVGFLCDHIEILFDVDHLFRKFAVQLGVKLERTESLNASVPLAKAVADLAERSFVRLAQEVPQGREKTWG